MVAEELFDLGSDCPEVSSTTIDFSKRQLWARKVSRIQFLDQLELFLCVLQAAQSEIAKAQLAPGQRLLSAEPGSLCIGFEGLLQLPQCQQHRP